MRGAWWLCTASALLAPIKAPQKRTKRRAVLTVGTPLDWPDALDRLAYVREHGIDQFIEMWRRSQTLKRDDDLLWGDEVEYGVFRVNAEAGTVCAPFAAAASGPTHAPVLSGAARTGLLGFAGSRLSSSSASKRETVGKHE